MFFQRSQTAAENPSGGPSIKYGKLIMLIMFCVLLAVILVSVRAKIFGL